MTRRKTTTTWGSQNAEVLFKLAIRLAGFDSKELMLMMHKIQRDKNRKINEATVLKAMDIIYESAKSRRKEKKPRVNRSKQEELEREKT